jgi:hypothetical protein
VKLSPERRRARRRRRLLSAAVGALVGLACVFVPEPYAVPCHIAAKVVGLLLGAH